jgi:hypothetical protein
MSKTPISLPFSEACERNKDVILDTINPILNQLESVLEVGSGTAQHALHFARENPNLGWQTSDQIDYIDGIEAQLSVAQLSNVYKPFVLDVNQKTWIESEQKYDGIYTANTLHIMTSDDVVAFFDGLPQVLKPQAYVMIYGPFKYSGEFTSESNARFDESLRSRECGSAIRDFESVNKLAENIGLRLVKDHKMPANNQLLIWQSS